jgi:hypothetical protein
MARTGTGKRSWSASKKRAAVLAVARGELFQDHPWQGPHVARVDLHQIPRLLWDVVGRFPAGVDAAFAHFDRLPHGLDELPGALEVGHDPADH